MAKADLFMHTLSMRISIEYTEGIWYTRPMRFRLHYAQKTIIDKLWKAVKNITFFCESIRQSRDGGGALI